MQVHRSHWIANAEVIRLIKNRTSLKVEMSDGTTVPISRRFAAKAAEALADKL
ncbi:LytTr DNA-binding domain-containing protein [Roseibium hamelinense]|uniref:LytTr DNA-binding domain-containing protein n=2 Tax=Roseibium hamelinense TaxID=150831 RepID=A0A562SMQ5_9HYPH|nr:LytTr DNA-binding domain-containing protein [Roseibium hamelinense]